MHCCVCCGEAWWRRYCKARGGSPFFSYCFFIAANGITVLLFHDLSRRRRDLFLLAGPASFLGTVSHNVVFHADKILGELILLIVVLLVGLAKILNSLEVSSIRFSVGRIPARPFASFTVTVLGSVVLVSGFILLNCQQQKEGRQQPISAGKQQSDRQNNNSQHQSRECGPFPSYGTS